MWLEGLTVSVRSRGVGRMIMWSSGGVDVVGWLLDVLRRISCRMSAMERLAL